MVKINFYEFDISDVDDIEIYAAYPIQEWITKTEKGKWVHEHCQDLTWYTRPNERLGWTITLRGSITDHHATEYYLKFKNESS